MATPDLLDDPVAPTLRRLSVPMGVGVVAMFLVNVIDTYWASHLGTDALAAMSFAFPVIGVVLNVSLGLMIGTSVAVSRAVGAGEHERANRLATHSMLLALGIVVMVTGIGLVTQDAVFTALGAPATLLPVIDAYMRVWYLSAVFLVVPMMLNGVLRAHGDALTARNVMILAAVFNGVLDPLFIFGWGPVPAGGLEGAAAATGVSRALTFVYALFIAFRMNVLDLHIPGPRELWESSKTILQVGVPATVTNVMGPIATAVLTAIVALHGSAAVAGYGIGARVESLLLIPAIALSSGLSPFVGQNWGAHLPLRVAEAFRVCVKFSLVWGAFAAVTMLAAAPYVAAVFTDDPAVAGSVVLYLRIVPFGYAAYCVMMMVSAAFNAVDHAPRATALSILRSIVFAIPMAIAGSVLFGLQGVFGGLAIASIVSALIGANWMRVFLSTSVRTDTADPVADASFLLDATPDDLRPATQQLVDHMVRLEGVELHKTRRDAVGFYVGERELGHIHPHGKLDLPLPHEVGEALVRLRRVDHHRLHDGGWYTHDLCDQVDTTEVEWLLAFAHALHELATRGPDDPITQAELDELEVPDELREPLAVCARRWECEAA